MSVTTNVLVYQEPECWLESKTLGHSQGNRSQRRRAEEEKRTLSVSSNVQHVEVIMRGLKGSLGNSTVSRLDHLSHSRDRHPRVVKARWRNEPPSSGVKQICLQKDGQQPLAPCDHEWRQLQAEASSCEPTEEERIGPDSCCFSKRRKLGKTRALIRVQERTSFQLLLHNPNPQRRHSVGKVCAEARKVWERARLSDVAWPGPR